MISFFINHVSVDHLTLVFITNEYWNCGKRLGLWYLFRASNNCNQTHHLPDLWEVRPSMYTSFPSGCAQIWEGLCISVTWNHSSFQNVSGVTHHRPFLCKWICKTIRPTYCSSDLKEKHENKGYNQCIIVNVAIGPVNVLCNKYNFKIEIWRF